MLFKEFSFRIWKPLPISETNPSFQFRKRFPNMEPSSFSKRKRFPISYHGWELPHCVALSDRRRAFRPQGRDFVFTFKSLRILIWIPETSVQGNFEFFLVWGISNFIWITLSESPLYFLFLQILEFPDPAASFQYFNVTKFREN